MMDLAIPGRRSPHSGDDGGDRGRLKIAFFGHDSNESTIRKRIRAFRSAGADVIGFMFSRYRDGLEVPVEWNNVDLGQTEDGYYLRRLARLWRAIKILRRHHDLLRRADVFYARNIDMLVLSRIAKAMVGSEAPLVYEVLDIHPAMSRRNGIGRILRFIERRLLKACSLLVISSPLFIERYFSAVQGYRGPWFLLENKVFATGERLDPPCQPQKPVAAPPWTIGWFGVIRCRRSLDILQRIAAAMPDRVVIHIRGTPSEPDGITKDMLEGLASEARNMHYFGPYRSPHDLAHIYGDVDLTWAVDFSAAGANSDWLIPNRLYEGGLYGVPAIARKGTATGKIVEEDGRGWCLDEPFEETFKTFLDQLDVATYDALRELLRKKERSSFVDIADTPRLIAALRQLVQMSTSPTRP